MARRRAGLTDDQVIKGGPVPPGADPDGTVPAETPESDPPAPKMTKVKVGNLEIEVPEEAAAAMQAEREAAQRAIEAREEMLRTVRTPERPSEPPRPANGKDPEEELDELMFTNPREYRKRLQERIMQEAENRYSAAETTRSFWDWYWQVNPTLKRLEHDVISEALFNRNLKQLQNLPLREAAVRLGAMVRDYLKTLTGETSPERKQEPRKPNRTTTLEGGSGNPRLERPVATGEDEPSLGDLIKARQNKIRGGGSRTQAS